MSGNLMSRDEIWDDTELIKMYEDSMNNATISDADAPAVSEKKVWQVGDMCMAPYEDDEKWYLAKILSINKSAKTAKVSYTEYEETAVVSLDNLFLENEVQYEDEEEEDVSEEPAAATSKAPATTKPFAIPTILPPPPELFKNVTNEKDITSNMMLSWYMSGYHTGYFQAMRDFQNKSAKR